MRHRRVRFGLGPRGVVLGCVVALLGAAPFVPWASAGDGLAPRPGDIAFEFHGRIANATTLGRQATAARLDSTYCRADSVQSTGTTSLIEGVSPGRVFALTADAGQWAADFDVSFFASRAICEAGGSRLNNWVHGGDEHGVVPPGAAVALVTLNWGRDAAFTYQELAADPFAPLHPNRRSPTVIAVIEPIGESGFSPYHFDFLASKHPWNTDADPDNDIDLVSDPARYIDGYPGSTPISLTLPVDGDENISNRYVGHEPFPVAEAAPTAAFLAAHGRELRAEVDGPDKRAWDSMEATVPGAAPKLYRFPGTKVIGALNFASKSGPGTGSVYAPPGSHGTKVASVAGGNFHGTCPECVFVLVTYHDEAVTQSEVAGPAPNMAAAVAWASRQKWIDVVTNSYGNSVAGADKAYFGDLRPETTRASTEEGQTMVWSSGNGIDGNVLAPNFTYLSGQKGPDWMVTVGGVSSANDQSPVGAGKPADISAYVHTYPSAGEPAPTPLAAEPARADTESEFSGTSNAAPVVAGTFAKVIQMGRDLLGDSKPGHSEGIVGSGKPRACAAGGADCPLRDGVLTRAEVQAVVFGNVLPSPPRPGTAPPPFRGDEPRFGLISPPDPHNYVAQGHGVIFGRSDPARFIAEQRRFSDALRGAVGPYVRPPGERAWMTVDSKCRQRLWGEWSGGYYTGSDPAFDPAVDQPAIAMNQACTGLPQDAFADFKPADQPVVQTFWSTVCAAWQPFAATYHMCVERP